MRSRDWWIYGGLVLIAAGITRVCVNGRRTPDPLAGMVRWEPDIATVREAVAKKVGINAEAGRREEFARLVKKRLRDHGFGISMRYPVRGPIHLSIVAPVPNPDKARIAIALHREAEALFGDQTITEIFATTGVGEFKVGEVRADGDSGNLRVTFGAKR